jgi:hypothetical protein
MSINSSAPSVDAISVTPNDSTDLSSIVRGLTCLVSGDASVITAGGTTVTVYLVAGAVMPLACRRVRSTGTAATGIVGLL